MARTSIELQVRQAPTVNEHGGDADAQDRYANALADKSDSNPSSLTAFATGDEFPEGGYGWVVIAACGVLT
jgi:hypothetical protein